MSQAVPTQSKDSAMKDARAIIEQLDHSGNEVRGLRVEAILNDRDSLLAVHGICVDRTRDYERVSNFLMRSGAKAPCFLLDFDIICAYLRGGIAGRATQAEIEYFFQASEVEYAIPVGAMAELLLYIERIGITQLLGPLNARDILEAELSDALNKTIDDGETKSGIRDRRIIEQALRLLELLENSRFRGVLRSYNHELAEQMQAYLEEEQHYGHELEQYKDRSLNNKRDAQNLAIAARQYERNGESPVEDRWCVLMSATTPVQRVARRLGSEYTAGKWLVVNPRTVVFADLLDFTRNKGKAGNLLRSIQKGWSGIEGHLYRRYRSIETASEQDFSAQDLSGVAKALEDEIVSLLEFEQAVRIEKINCQLPTISQLQVRQLGSATADLNSLEGKNDCFRLLDALRGSLSALDPGEAKYTTVELVDDSEHKSVGIRSQEASFGSDLFMALQFLRQDEEAKGLWARWDVCCDDDRLFAAVVETQKVLANSKGGSQLTDPEIVDEVTERRITGATGVVASSSMLAVYFPWGWIEQRGGWQCLTLASLYKSIREHAFQRRLVDPRWNDAGELIQELSIRLGGIRIVYEVVPKDDRINRQLSVFCKDLDENCADGIASLYDWTGMRFAFRPVLKNAIDEACRIHLQA